MDMVWVIGWLGAVVGTILAIPQVFRLLKTRKIEGVALSAWQVTLAINVAWLVHGFRIDQINMIVVNLFALLSTLTILVVMAQELRRPLVKVLLPGLVVGAVMMAVDHWMGGAVYGLVAAVPAVVGQLTQSVELVRAQRVTGVSKSFLVLGFVNFAIWGLWGFLAGDQAAFIASAATGVVALFNVIWLTVRLSGFGPIAPRPLEPALAGMVPADAVPVTVGAGRAVVETVADADERVACPA